MRVAQALAGYAVGIRRWFTSRNTNGLLEGRKSTIQAAKAKARGFRTTHNITTIAYLLAANSTSPHARPDQATHAI